MAAWYQTHSYEVLERNWRCRDGEIDLIVRTGDTVAFCEVKTRSNDRFGSPAEAVTAGKQMRLRRLAVQYLVSRTGEFFSDVRFDVASVIGNRVEVLTGAF